MVMANHGMCAVTSLVNALNLICGKSMARVAQRLWEETRPRARKVEALTYLLYGLRTLTVNYPKVEFDRVPKLDMDYFKRDHFPWLAKRRGGAG